MAVTIINETLHLQFDSGTTPLLGGFSILAVIGAILRRKMRSVFESLPREWSE